MASRGSHRIIHILHYLWTRASQRTVLLPFNVNHSGTIGGKGVSFPSVFSVFNLYIVLIKNHAVLFVLLPSMLRNILGSQNGND